MNPKRYLPILQWLPSYGRVTLTSDLVAAVIVTLMLVPQALAYSVIRSSRASSPPRAS